MSEELQSLVQIIELYDWDGRCVFLQKEQQKACRLPR